MFRSVTRQFVALLFALAACACGARQATTPAPAVTPTEPVATRPIVESLGTGFDYRYVGSGLPRDVQGSPVDLYGAEAADLPEGLAWANAERPLSLKQLRGKLLLLDFWDYDCIECLHNLADLERLQREYPDYLVVIGVYSGRFAGEESLESLRVLLERHNITHPVIYDPRQRTWYEWGVEAAPTLVLVDPAGNLAHMHVGPGAYAAFRPLIGVLVSSFEARGALDDTPLSSLSEHD